LKLHVHGYINQPILTKLTQQRSTQAYIPNPHTLSFARSVPNFGVQADLVTTTSPPLNSHKTPSRSLDLFSYMAPPNKVSILLRQIGEPIKSGYSIPLRQ